MPVRFEQIRHAADQVRNIELVAVLQHVGAMADQKAPGKWHTPQGVLSVTGRKFFNWSQSVGGGGAIDLTMHLRGCDFLAAVCWLAHNFPCASLHVPKKVRDPAPRSLALPDRNQNRLPRVIGYLTEHRCLPTALVRSLIKAGNLYADNRANAVFLLLGKAKTVVGAEIRGTSSKPWHALATGSRKDLGFFYVKSHSPNKIVICESAIDAISYHTLDPDSMALSTAGAHPNPPWLPHLINQRIDIFCGYDADTTGDNLAEKMITLHPSLRRLRPTLHDWNDVLKASHR